MVLIVGLLFSLGAINALVPVIIILVLLVAAAGLNRGYSLFNFFGLTTLAGINPGGKSSLAGKSGFNFAAAYIGPGVGSTLKVGKKVFGRAARRVKRAVARNTIMRMPNAPSRAPPGKVARKARAFGRAVFMDKPKTTVKKMGKWTSAHAAAPQTGMAKSAKGAVTAGAAAFAGSTAGRFAGGVAKPARSAAKSTRNFASKKVTSVKGKLTTTPKTKTGKILKGVAKYGALGAASPVVAAGAGAYSMGRATGPRRAKEQEGPPGSKKSRFHKSSFESAVQFGKTAAFMVSPSLYVGSRVKAGIKNVVEKRESIRRQARSEQRTIDDRAAKGLSTTGVTRYGKAKDDASSMAHGSALKVAERHIGNRQYSDLSKSEKRSLKKAVNAELDKAYGKTGRTVVGAAAIGGLNLYRAAKDGVVGGGGAKGAATAMGKKLRENVKNVGMQGTSLGTAKIARAAIDSVFLAKIGAQAGREISITDPRLKNDRQRNLVAAAQEAHILQTRDPAKLQEHLSRIEGDLHKLGYTVPSPQQKPSIVQVAGAGAAQINSTSKKPQSNSDMVERLIQQKVVLGQNKKADPSTIAQLAADPDKRVSVSALRNANLSDADRANHMQAQISKEQQLRSEILNLHQNLANQTDLTGPVAQQLKAEISSRAAELGAVHQKMSSLIDNPKTDKAAAMSMSTEILQTQSQFKQADEQISSNPAASGRKVHLSDIMAGRDITAPDNEAKIKDEVSKHAHSVAAKKEFEKAPRETLEKLSQDPDPTVSKLADNELKSRDTYGTDVKTALMRVGSADEPTLRSLAGDSDPTISSMAKAELRKRFGKSV